MLKRGPKPLQGVVSVAVAAMSAALTFMVAAAWNKAGMASADTNGMRPATYATIVTSIALTLAIVFVMMMHWINSPETH
jgi:hypothetical protein